MDEALPIWLEYADADLSTALFLYEKQWPRQLEIICYHCQQAGEKAVKALYLAAEIPGGIPRKHDLWFLLEQIKGKVSTFQKLFWMLQRNWIPMQSLSDTLLKTEWMII